MARPARRPRPHWRTVTLLAFTLRPVSSFSMLPSATVRRSATTAVTAPVSSDAARASLRAGGARIAAGHQGEIGVDGGDAPGPESVEVQVVEHLSSLSPSEAEPPDVEAVDNDVTSDAGAENGAGEQEGLQLADAAADAAAAKKGSRSKQPPLVARNLDSVRGSLIRQEETIIFALIEREQFRCNSPIYTDRTFRVNRRDAADIYGRDASFLEYMLCETEKLHATVRRYMSLEELAFFPMFLPEPILPPLEFPRLLAPNNVNVNDQILSRYVTDIVPMICEPGDDEQHGSSVVCDVNALQALSRRVHLGKFVAESKFQNDSKTYQDLCRAGDARGVLELLTNKAVEKRVLQRAFIKASTYGRDINDVSGLGPQATEDEEGGGGAVKEEGNFKVNPQYIVDIYRDTVIPLTKDVEILYLFQRTGYPCPSLEGIHDS
ncbi:unnamed protein product [Scytosiphon promiscuus]